MLKEKAKKKLLALAVVTTMIIGASPISVGAQGSSGINNTEVEQSNDEEIKEYEVSTSDDLTASLSQIAVQSEPNAKIILKGNIKIGAVDYVSSLGVKDKHIIVTSDGDNLHTLTFSNRGMLNGDCTFDKVNVEGYKLYCNGYKTIFTSKGEIHLSGTLYGGGYQTTVDKTYVVIAANGEINPNATNGLHNVIGGSYQGSVTGDTYLEITGNIKMKGGNHITPGCVMGDGTSGDSKTSPDVYVGGTATLIYDSESKSSPSIVGTTGCEMRGDVVLEVRAGATNEICGNYEYPEKSIIKGNLHIIAGSKNYENTDRVLRLGSNWPITGAGNLFAKSPFSTGTYEVDGNVTIDTYENVWGWNKNSSPSDDIPEIYGSICSKVGGTITINANGSHMENITGAYKSTVNGNVSIDADNVELKNSYYETEYDEGDIMAVNGSTVTGKSLVKVTGGDVNMVMLTSGKQVNPSSSIIVSGSPKIRTGILSTTNYDSSPENSPSVIMDSCKATIPFIQSASEVKVQNNSNVTLNGLWLARNLTIDEGNVLKTNDDVVELEGDATINGTWQQLYNQTKDGYDCIIDKTLTIGKQGQYISLGTTCVTGIVDTSGMMALMKNTLFENDYSSDKSEIRLPVVSSNYDGTNDGGIIPLQIKGQSSGSTTVNTVKEDDWQILKAPTLGDNYILSKKDNDAPKQSTFVLGNQDAIAEGHYLKRIKDVNNKNENYMWQVAKKIIVTFDKNGGDSEASPQTSTQDFVAGTSSYHFDLPAKNPTRSNYKFIGWNTKKDGSGETFTNKYEVTSNMTVYAQWKKKEVPASAVQQTSSVYKVEHYQQQKEGSYKLKETDFPLYGKIGSEVQAKANNYAHYSLDKVMSTSKGTVTQVTTNKDGQPEYLVLRMYYNLEKNTVSYDLNGGNGTGYNTQEVLFGNGVEVKKAPTKEYHTFTGWKIKGTNKVVQPQDTYTVKGNVKFVAQWDSNILNEEASITPMDITIYTGGNGYSGVIGADGQFSKNDLPEIGFYVTLSDKINSLLGSKPNIPVDLSNAITLTYDDNKGITRRWKLTPYGDETHSQATENGRKVYIYKLEQSNINGTDELIPARMQFTSTDGKVMVSSSFPVNEKDQYRDYTMSFYEGNLSRQYYRLEINIGDKKVYCPVDLKSGTLKVRGNVNQYYATITDELPKSNNKDEILAQTSQKNTNYFINDGSVRVTDASGVKLLVDKTLDDPLLINYLNQNKNANGKYSYKLSYLDIVDTQNGNDYLSLGDGQKIKVYWPVPEDAKKDSQYHVVHFKGLTRDNDISPNDLLTTHIPEELECQTVTINGRKYIQFETSSFSPFALLYEKENKNNITIKVKDEQESHKQQKTTKNYVLTGDNTNIALWVSLSIVAIVFIIIMFKKNK